MQKVLLLFIAAAVEMAIRKTAGGDAARMAATGKAALHGVGWGDDIMKVAAGEAARIAAAGKAALHGGGWGDGIWEGGWRRGG